MSWVTAYGVTALTFMMVMYWLEHRGSVFVLGFALGCVLSSMYGFLAGAWPFGMLEAIWCLIALRRYAAARAGGLRRTHASAAMIERTTKDSSTDSTTSSPIG